MAEKYFPEIGIPSEILSDARLVDVSWGNDCCPSYQVKPGGGIEEWPCLYVEHADPAKRYESESLRRFNVCSDTETFCSTDSVKEAIDCLISKTLFKFNSNLTLQII